MKLYHSTTTAAAQMILRAGFRDVDFFGVAKGVFFSDRPLFELDGVAMSAEVTLQVVPTAAPLE